MGKIMSKRAILTHLAGRLDLAKKQVGQVMDELHALAAREAKKTGFVLPGFGKFVLVHRKARVGRNPQTGEPLKIPAQRVVRFRVGKALKDAVLGRKK
jgi:DNA-binding protein HU-beta